VAGKYGWPESTLPSLQARRYVSPKLPQVMLECMPERIRKHINRSFIESLIAGVSKTSYANWRRYL